MAEQRCTGCDEVKPLGDFYRDDRGRYGRRTRCKQCYAAEAKARKAANPAKEAARQRRWAQANKDRVAARARRSRQRHPERYRARQILRRALRAGKITKPDHCERCGRADTPFANGRSSVEGHHADYSRPLDVEWLCHPCHVALHEVAA